MIDLIFGLLHLALIVFIAYQLWRGHQIDEEMRKEKKLYDDLSRQYKKRVK